MQTEPTQSKRYSTYTASPTFTYATSATTLASGMADIKYLSEGFERLENKRLQQQRFVPSQKKNDDMSKLSLGAKVQRALDLRLSDQDAVLRVKTTSVPIPSPASSRVSSLMSFDEKKGLVKVGVKMLKT